MITEQLVTILDIGMRVIAVALLVALLVAILLLIIRITTVFWLVRRKMTTLEIKQAAIGDRSIQATTQLFVALRQLTIPTSVKDRLLGRYEPLCLEIAASKTTGICFRVRVSSGLAKAVRRHIQAHVPDAQTDLIEETTLHVPSKVTTYLQKGHYAFPLTSPEQLEIHDPIAYITNAMTKLSSEEAMTFQVVIRATTVRGLKKLRDGILQNEDVLTRLTHARQTKTNVLTSAINNVLFGILDGVGGVYHSSSKPSYLSAQKDMQYEKQVAKRLKPVRTLSFFEHELISSVHHKLSQPLYAVDIRVAIAVDTIAEYRKRRAGVEAGLVLYDVPKYQSLKRLHNVPWLRSYQAFLFTKGLPSLMTKNTILSAEELAGLYHLPHSLSAKTENVVKSLSRTLPAPVSLKGTANLDILLGANEHHGSITSIGLTAEERQRHIYIIGGTGNGKTTMMQYAIIQDIHAGKGVAVLDPHGDLAETILRHIPESRIKDVIYINPDDLGHPIGLNLLELSPDVTGDDLLRDKDIITESTISVMRKIFSDDDSGGHRIEYVLRNAIQTALTLETPTLFTIFELLNDAKFRRDVVRNLKDQNLKNFWKNELGKAGEFQRVKMAAGITAKIGRFLFSASARRVLEQKKSTIDFDDILATNKILICNFSKGLLGEDTSTLFGTTMLAKLQVASLRRARQQQAERTPYFLYVDEFQNFATMSFVQMLSEARKYKLFLTMAEQSTSQQDQQRLVDIILANVGTVICFRSGSPADERYLLPLFTPYIEQGEIANLPAYTFYARIAAMQSQEPMSGKTVLLDNHGSQRRLEQVVASSRKLYATEVKEEPEISEVVIENVATQQSKKTRPKDKSMSVDAEPVPIQ